MVDSCMNLNCSNCCVDRQTRSLDPPKHEKSGFHLQIIFLAVRNVPLLFRFSIRPGWFGILINHYPLVHMACSATAADKKSGQSLSHVHLEAR